MDLDEYINNVELEPALSLYGESSAIFESAEDTVDVSKMKAAVDAGSILAFVDGLTEQEKEDVLYSTQFAQRAASKKADRFLEVADWYREYVKWLENLGWVIPQFGFGEYELDEGDFKMDAAALKIIGAVAAGGSLTILKTALDVMEGLKDDSGQITLFDSHSSTQFGGNFQMGEVYKSDNHSLSIALGAFYYKSADKRKKFLFFKWGKREVNFWVGANSVVLNTRLYDQVRQTVKDKIDADSKLLIADIEL